MVTGDMNNPKGLGLTGKDKCSELTLQKMSHSSASKSQCKNFNLVIATKKKFEIFTLNTTLLLSLFNTEIILILKLRTFKRPFKLSQKNQEPTLLLI